MHSTRNSPRAWVRRPEGKGLLRGACKPNCRAADFRAQLASAANDDPAGPIPVWLWPQGPFRPESWEAVQYAEGESAAGYLGALKEYSRGTRR